MVKSSFQFLIRDPGDEVFRFSAARKLGREQKGSRKLGRGEEGTADKPKYGRRRFSKKDHIERWP